MYRFFFLYPVLLFSILLTSCQQNSPLKQEVDSNAEMAKMLDSLYVNANPLVTYNVNSRLAVILKQKMEQASTPEEKIMAHFQYANELLNSGEIEESIRELEDIVKQLGGIDAVLNNPEIKNLAEQVAVAYLRLGEVQNCVQNHTSASCIIPIAPAGQHKLTNGSENAIQWYTAILNKYPDDYQSRWLLNIANMTLGKYPQGVPAKWRVPESTFKPSYPDFKFFNDVAIPLGLDIKGMSGGTAIEDFNNDGLLDIFCTAYGLREQAQLLLNKGDGTFENVTTKAGLTGITSGLNVNHADYNNDGFSDILMMRGAWLRLGGKHPNSLLKNNGDGTFTDVSKQSGILSFHPTPTASWGDFNNDGWIDLFIGNETRGTDKHPCELYLNKKDGTFVNIAPKVGLAVQDFVKGSTWGDFNNDGLLDLYLSTLGSPNMLFMNRGGTSPDNWKFENIAAKAGVQEPEFGFPCWAWDFDNDGLQDIFVSGYDARIGGEVGGDAGREYFGVEPIGEKVRFYKNIGNEKFLEISKPLGINKVVNTMGCNFDDINSDGFLDFYLATGAPDFRALAPNRMFVNVGGKKIEEVTMYGFANLQKGHGVGMGDLDNDGDQDIYTVMGGAYEGDVAQNVLFENPGFDNNFLTLLLEGVISNRSAIGAKIKVNFTKSDGQKSVIWRTVTTGGSFGSSSLQQEIGLGKAKSVESVEIIWPNGKIAPVTYTEFALNTMYRIKEGTSTPQKLERKAFVLNTKGGAKGHGHQ